MGVSKGKKRSSGVKVADSIHEIASGSPVPEEAVKIRRSLVADIRKVIREQAKELGGATSLGVSRPERAVFVLLRYSMGMTVTKLVKKYGYARGVVKKMIVDYADHLGRWKDLGGRLASYSYLDIVDLESRLVERLHEQLDSKEGMTVQFKDLKELSIARANASREALTARGEASQITEERKIVTQEDYEETMRKAQERLEQMKRVKEVDGA